jgi:hypothetical protein
MATRSRAHAAKGSALLPIILAAWTGCASMQDTPQQEYVWAMGRICDAKSNTWFMDKVEADGRYTIRGAANSVPSPNLAYFDCMQEQFKARPIPGGPRPRKSSAARARFQASPLAAAAAFPGDVGKVDPTAPG